MNEKLSAIAKKAADNLLAYISEHEDKILEAWNAAEREAQDNETKPKFRLGYTITLDLDNDTMETALSWSVRCKVCGIGPIPETDNAQLRLDVEEEI